MKKLMFVAALAVAAASPALAQTRHARPAPAQLAPAAQSQPVFDAGQYVGNDPDANVRLDLRRDNRRYGH